MLKLASDTPAGWASWAAGHLDEILLDHAHCEKKAAGNAMTLLFQYPDQPSLQRPLSELAREELRHFEQVLTWLARRGRGLERQRPAPYAGRLRKLVRDGEPARLIDLLLCSAAIEARSCERLGLLAQALPEPELAAFYRGLRAAEARHHGLYVELACTVAGPDVVRDRLAEVTAHEAQVLAEAPVLPRLHAAAGEQAR